MGTSILLTVALGFASAAPLAAGQDAKPIPERVEESSIRNYERITEGLAVAGQPTVEALRGLKQLGFGTVVNLRTPGEFEEDEAAIVSEAGLEYVSVPISSADFSSADADAVAKALDAAGAAPVLLHCGSSNRVGGVLAVLEARRGGSIEEALAFGKAAGLRSASMIEAATRVIEAER